MDRTLRGLHWRWTGAPAVHVDDAGVPRGRLRVAVGDRHDLVLRIADRDPAGPDPRRGWASTARPPRPATRGL
ncbi:hypothetical protein ABT297_26385 [Dactylosporangium sp. NPDC000555]|uniref:hypothetical protein n=1 Tax=Dactylosporangium sp. NPDC000555 TaxID=3154260 RepID=UPI00332BDF06